MTRKGYKGLQFQYIYEVFEGEKRISVRRASKQYIAAAVTRLGRVSYIGRYDLIERHLSVRFGAEVAYLVELND
jgi:hypothetical protein